MGVADYLGWKWRSSAGLPVINIPGCPAQPDNMTEVLMYLVFHLAGMAPVPTSTSSCGRSGCSSARSGKGCNRAGFVEEGNFATEYGSDHRCLVKLGCKGPVVKCNVPVRGWVNGIGGCPNVGGNLHGLHDARVPRQVHAVHGSGSVGERRCQLRAVQLRPDPELFRKRNIKNKYDIEPEWRRRGSSLTSGYQPRW